jgi:hypothetical protein
MQDYVGPKPSLSKIEKLIIKNINTMADAGRIPINALIVLVFPVLYLQTSGTVINGVKNIANQSISPIKSIESFRAKLLFFRKHFSFYPQRRL